MVDMMQMETMAPAMGDPQQMMMDPTQPQEQVINREYEEPEPSQREHIKKWIKNIEEAEGYFDKPMKRIKKDMEYAFKGCDPDRWDPDEEYTVPLVQRHLNQAVAALYAKNPKASAKRKRRLVYTVWDGTQSSLDAAMQMASQATLDPMTMQPVVDPNAQAIIQDIEQAKTQQAMLDKLGQTLEILFSYYTDEQQPNFKLQMKQLVRRVKTCGVGYIKLGFQRIQERRPEVSARIADVTDQIAVLERIMADIADGETPENSAEYVELKAMLEQLQSQEYINLREGLIFDFPRATEVIVDTKTRQLKGWIGTTWLAHKFCMTSDEIKETFKKDIKAAKYDDKGQLVFPGIGSDDGQKKKDDVYEVYEVWDKKTNTVFTIAKGYCEYLIAPRAPDVKLERFFNIYALTFNDVESEKEIYPPSDVYCLRHPQDEYNRSRQGLREHRHANRPKYVTQKGRLEEEDKAKLRSHPRNAVIELNALKEGEPVNSLLQPLTGAPIDPKLYNTEDIMQDVLYAVGAQEANLGPTTDATATQSSIAESSRMASTQSNVDDLDEFLSEIARDSSSVMLLNLSMETVKEIAGPGAVWPEFSRDEIAKEIYLDVRAGSSGKPNRAAELANMERAAPFLMQAPGLNPTPIIRKYLEALDIDVEEALAANTPSIVAMNAMITQSARQNTMAAMGGAPQLSTGNPQTDPNQQQAQGGMNTQQPPGQPSGPQPAYPAGT